MVALLNMTKVAVGCAELDTLRVRLESRAEGGATHIVTRFRPKRAHQGWRYLAGPDAPVDLGGEESDGIDALPGAMVAELSALALI